MELSFLKQPGRSPDLRGSGRPYKIGTGRNREDFCHAPSLPFAFLLRHW